MAAAQQQREQDLAAEEAAKAIAKQCQSCEGMKDFVTNLQEEIKRLASITDNLKRQVIDCGGEPEIPHHLRHDKKYLGQDGKTYLPAFKNVCPACRTFKQT